MPRVKASPVEELGQTINTQQLLSVLTEWQQRVHEFDEYNQRKLSELGQILNKKGGKYGARSSGGSTRSESIAPVEDDITSSLASPQFAKRSSKTVESGLSAAQTES